MLKRFYSRLYRFVFCRRSRYLCGCGASVRTRGAACTLCAAVHAATLPPTQQPQELPAWRLVTVEGATSFWSYDRAGMERIAAANRASGVACALAPYWPTAQ